MKLIIHTAFGVFHSKPIDLSESGYQEIVELVKNAVSGGKDYLSFELNCGRLMVFSKDVLTNCLIEVER